MGLFKKKPKRFQELVIKSMHCENCEKQVQQLLLSVAGVVTVQADHTTGKVVVGLSGDNDLALNSVNRLMEPAGYKVSAADAQG